MDSSCSTQTIQYIFAALLLVTGLFGTCCQVVAVWLYQLGGPREPPRVGVWGGMAGSKPYNIAIADRRLIAIAATTLSSYGSAMLFAAVIAGLVESFPHWWSVGLALWAIVIISSSFLILRSGYRSAFNVRRSQEDDFDQLPQDGEQSVHDGKVYETAAYRSEILSKKPDLDIRIANLSKSYQVSFLVRSITNAYRRERKQP